jgi:hypothetical protein
MSTSSEDSIPDRVPDPQRRASVLQTLWPRVIELWLSAVLTVFLFIRVLGSQTAQRILSRFLHTHLP